MISPKLHPQGFRIANALIAASFAHPSSFQIDYEHPVMDSGCVSSSTSLGGADGFFARYWDENVVLVVMQVKHSRDDFEALAIKESGEDARPQGWFLSFHALTSSYFL